MKQAVTMRAEFDVCQGAKANLKELRRALARMAKIAPEHAVTTFEAYQYPKADNAAGRTPFWYLRAVATWTVWA